MKKFLILPTATLALVVGCQGGKPTATAPAAAKLDPSSQVAVVNGEPLTKELFGYYVKAVSGKEAADISAEQRQKVLDNLVRAEVVAQKAIADGDDKDPETAALLYLARLDVLQRRAQQRYLEGKDPTEQEIRTEYETQVAAMPKIEYRARHILVATESYAKQVIAQLEKGARFEQLAQRESMDPSKQQGGDLGWFTPDRMVKPFSDAVAALKKGEYTHTPVQSQFGWHIIRLDDTRETTPPPFDAVKEQLGPLVQAKRFRSYVDTLIGAAKVDKAPVNEAVAAPAAAGSAESSADSAQASDTQGKETQ
ncbi:MAG: peptidylprolyl isomerase [Steroidobacteraceae bacterium]